MKDHISAVFTVHPDYQADNLFLPFNLLAARTFLPPAVLILLRKPCTLFLEIFFGWNVIFMRRTPPSYYLYSAICTENNNIIIGTKEPAVKKFLNKNVIIFRPAG